MRVDLFDFALPPEKIAQHPIFPRDRARLLVVGDNNLCDSYIYDLPNFLRRGDLLVFNNSKVIAAALRGAVELSTGRAQVRVNLLKQEEPHSWWVLSRPAKRLTVGTIIEFAPNFCARVEAARDFGERLLHFDCEGDALLRQLDEHGEMPLPPYIKRNDADFDVDSGAEVNDRRDYQTIFAERLGSVAAPTAGLHFSEPLMARLQSQGIGIDFVTLHVGGGTFLPVRSEDTDSHRMHSEYGEVSAALWARIAETRKNRGRIVAVGTTTLRILEAAALAHAKTPEKTPEKTSEKAFAGETDIFITPGFKFSVIDRLLTNFHLPRSTLFMLVAAFCGLERIHQAYAHAIGGDYRFFSYGDACLLERA